jgi:uroporphyrinogen-III synthase
VPEVAFNSEALLAMPQLHNVSGRRIIIFRGEGGRELLGDTLVNRGAQVVYANVYRRALPELDKNKLIQPWMQAQNSAVIVTSQEGLDNLVMLLDADAGKRLRQTPIVVISERILDKARQHGIQAPVVIAKQASDEAILEALIELSRQQNI